MGSGPIVISKGVIGVGRRAKGHAVWAALGQTTDLDNVGRHTVTFWQRSSVEAASSGQPHQAHKIFWRLA